MRNSQLAIDSDFVRRRIAELGLSQARLAVQCGRYEEWTKRLLKTGRSPDLAQALPGMAKALQCSIADICPEYGEFAKQIDQRSADEHWAIRSGLNISHGRQTTKEFANAVLTSKTHLTIHHGLNSYLVHPDYCLLRERKVVLSGLDPASRQRYEERAPAIRSTVVQAHVHTPYDVHHRVVAPASFFADATSLEQVLWTIDRIDEYGKRGFQHRLTLCILPDEPYHRLELLIGHIVGNPNWSTINIIGDEFCNYAVGWSWHITKRSSWIRGLRRRLVKAIRTISPDFPDDESSVSRSRTVNNQSLGELESMTHKLVYRRNALNHP